MLSLNSIFVLHAEDPGVLIWSAILIHATKWTLKYSQISSRVTVIQTMDDIRKRLKQQHPACYDQCEI